MYFSYFIKKLYTYSLQLQLIANDSLTFTLEENYITII